MIARIRGDHHDLSWGRWRPRPSHPLPADGRPQTVRPSHGQHSTTRGRKLTRWLVVVAAIAAGACAAALWAVGRRATPATPTTAAMPGTPRAWLDAYEAAAVDDPSRVCSQLFAGSLAAAYGRAVHGGCRAYFAQIMSSSVTVRRILRDGDTATLELRQTIGRKDWAVVLNRRPRGWQAVDLLAGRLLR